MNKQYPIIRKSPIFFTMKILGMVILLSLLYELLVFATDIDSNLNETIPFFQSIEFGLAALCFIIFIEVIYGLVLVFYWTRETYEVHHDEIIHRFGFFTVQEKRFSLKNIENIFYKDTLWGRFLNYGSIELQRRFSKELITMNGISDAHYYVELIKRTTILSDSKIDETEEKNPLEI